MVDAVDDAGGPRWLSSYYGKTQSECEISLRRRDNVTNWSYVIMAAAVGTYAGFFAGDSGVPSLGRLGLAAGALIVLSRFFVMSAIAYGYYQRARYFRERIEKHWIWGEPTLDEITSDIRAYDHQRSMPPGMRGLIEGQVRSGAVITIIVPVILLGIEMFREQGLGHCMILACLGGYAALEIRNYRSYGQIRPPPGRAGAAA